MKQPWSSLGFLYTTVNINVKKPSAFGKLTYYLDSDPNHSVHYIISGVNLKLRLRKAPPKPFSLHKQHETLFDIFLTYTLPCSKNFINSLLIYTQRFSITTPFINYKIGSFFPRCCLILCWVCYFFTRI